jgi:hypothetical protein
MFINSKWKESYTRTYIKIQGVFDFIGGFISLVLMILKFVCAYVIYPDKIKIFYDKLNKKHDVDEKKNTIHAAKNKNEFKDAMQLNQIPTSTPRSPVRKSLKGKNSLNSNNKFSIINTTESQTATEPNKSTIKIVAMRRHSVQQKKISFEFKKFNFFEKLGRLFCCCTENYKKRLQQLAEIEKMFQKKLSMEHITNLSRKVKLFECMIFEEHHRNLMKFIEIPRREKIPYEFEEMYSQLKDEINEGKTFINQKLLFHLKK